MNIEEDINILKQLIREYKRKPETQNEFFIGLIEERALENLVTAYEEEKEKVKWKPIKDYDRKKYDWVLVKYFDGDYECVPEVAERRNDGKWYTSERQIPFEVKYFFDMQEILKEK